MTTSPSSIRLAPPASPEDRDWLAELWRAAWGGETMVTRGQTHRLVGLEAVIAWSGEERVGAATYQLGEDDCELMSLNAVVEGWGIGTALLTAVETAAREAGKRRLWLITTNDNLEALRFYQRRGYRLRAVYPGAVDEARRLKPTIPEIGRHGIPLHDEIELEKPLV